MDEGANYDGRNWEYLPVAEVMESAGLWPIKEYIQRIQDTAAAQVACRPIYELCIGSERMKGTKKFMWWWEHGVGLEVE